MAILLIGTLDTKSAEIAYLRDRLEAGGASVCTVDVGSRETPGFPATIPRAQVFAAAGLRPESVPKLDRTSAVNAAVHGMERIARAEHAAGHVQGVLAVGGSAGTTIATAAMRALPLGLPKVMVSTMASGQVSGYVGVQDICMMPAVVDACGLNRLSRRILANAADAMLGMIHGAALPAGPDRPMLAASMFGVTTPCVERAVKCADADGYETLVFHATGTGGRTLETLVRDGLIVGVLDLTTTELADELVGGVLSAGPDRLTAAAIRGIPQVIAPGALDMVNFGAMESVPEKFRNRRFHVHNANVTLMRTTPEECDALGKEIAQKACAARGPTTILLPLRGLSAIDCDGGAFAWPEANAALFQSIRNWLMPDVELIELDLHINDPAFADAAYMALRKHLPARVG